MSTFDEDESSVESSQPREGIEIILPAVTYRIATGTRNLVIDGRTYTASPASRGEVGISSSGDPRSLVVSLPMSHAVCQRYMAGGVPPRQILINVWRQQVISGETEKVWSGYVTSMAPEKHVGRFNVPSRTSETLERRLPTMTVGRACPHVLYDANCRVVRADFTVATTVATFNGRVVTVVDALFSDDVAGSGELVHVASGERMTVQSKAGSDVTMQLPIWELKIGDAVEVSQGCTHLLGGTGGCQQEYANEVNYGGTPDLPGNNPFTVGGLGTIQS